MAEVVEAAAVEEQVKLVVQVLHRQVVMAVKVLSLQLAAQVYMLQVVQVVVQEVQILTTEQVLLAAVVEGVTFLLRQQQEPYIKAAEAAAVEILQVHQIIQV
jgi:hypothetical protein